MTATGFHISGPCQAAYARGCRCPDCRHAWTQGRRRQRNGQPSLMALEVDRLNRELAAAWEENAMLRCRLNELEAP